MKLLLALQLLFLLASIWLSIELLALRRRLFPPAAAGQHEAVSSIGRKAVAVVRRAIAVLLVTGLIYFMLMRGFVHLISQ